MSLHAAWFSSIGTLSDGKSRVSKCRIIEGQLYMKSNKSSLILDKNILKFKTLIQEYDINDNKKNVYQKCIENDSVQYSYYLLNSSKTYISEE